MIPMMTRVGFMRRHERLIGATPRLRQQVKVISSEYIFANGCDSGYLLILDRVIGLNN
jgi:hypothetical protein